MSDFFKECDCDMGLLIHEGNTTRAGKKGISLDKANRLLQERGTVVYADKSLHGEYWGPTQDPTDNHRALLINVSAIEKDSAEKIVEDMIGLCGGWHPRVQDLIDRARKLRGEK